MAVKKITCKKTPFNEITKVAFETATSVNDGFKFKMPSSDEYVVILVKNTEASAAKKIAVKAPSNGGYAASTSDLELSLSAGEIAVVRIESARYANNNGEVILIPEATTVQATVIY